MSVERQVQIRNRHGLHARPAAEFVKLASSYAAEVHVEKDGLEVNGKSIMGVLMLAAEPGAVLTLRAEGEDAEELVDALADFVRRDVESDEGTGAGHEDAEAGRETTDGTAARGGGGGGAGP